MTKFSISLSLSIFLYLSFLLLILYLGDEASQSQAKVASALFIFGDSTVNAGNNNNFNHAKAKANFYPNGIDHPLGTTGRFTNGLTIADFFAQSLGLHFQPAIMDRKLDLNNIYEGLNYASGSAGILDETTKSEGEILSLKKQVRLFRKTVHKYLASHLKNPARLGHYLSNSIFLLSIGTNDFVFYINPAATNISKQYNLDQFADLLLQQLSHRLEDLHQLGARKFVVTEIGAVGCAPVFAAMVKPPSKTKCLDQVNDLVSIYNLKLAAKLKELGSMLEGSIFVLGKGYNFTLDIVQNPTKYGFKDATTPCATGVTAICEDRKTHVFWDSIHPTEAAYSLFASQCFSGAGVCVPFNAQQLSEVELKENISIR